MLRAVISAPGGIRVGLHETSEGLPVTRVDARLASGAVPTRVMEAINRGLVPWGSPIPTWGDTAGVVAARLALHLDTRTEVLEVSDADMIETDPRVSY